MTRDALRCATQQHYIAQRPARPVAAPDDFPHHPQPQPPLPSPPPDSEQLHLTLSVLHGLAFAIVPLSSTKLPIVLTSRLHLISLV